MNSKKGMFPPSSQLPSGAKTEVRGVFKAPLPCWSPTLEPLAFIRGILLLLQLMNMDIESVDHGKVCKLLK